MSLNGLSVDEWMIEHRPAGGANHPQGVVELCDRGHSRDQQRNIRKPRNAIVWALAAAVAAWLAAPSLTKSSSCPPPGEGATYCYLQHNVLAAAMTFLLVSAGTVIACRLVLSLPGFVTRVRSGGLLPRSPSAAVHNDPLLIAANRGFVN